LNSIGLFSTTTYWKNTISTLATNFFFSINFIYFYKIKEFLYFKIAKFYAFYSFFKSK